jgi:uncharacterized repeat protein (TIGR03803 family)
LRAEVEFFRSRGFVRADQLGFPGSPLRKIAKETKSRFIIMKTIFAFLALLTFAVVVPAPKVAAATFTNLYLFSADAFTSGPNAEATNGDGVGPSGFVVSGNTLYGTAFNGGLYGYGTIYRVDISGQNFTNYVSFNLGTFNATSNDYDNSTGDYANPGLLLVSNTLYGTTFMGGTHDAGTVFKINTDGSGFSVLHSFNVTDGQGPSSGLTQYGNELYGTTAGGGTNGSGTIFAINLTTLSFSGIVNFTNQEEPYGGVVVVSNVLYGFGRYGGNSSNGVVYSAGGGGYSILFNFNGVTGSGSYATPTLSGNTLFGVTYQGGTNGGGNIFRIDTSGLHYTNLFSFQAQSGANTTGSNPYDFAGLVLSGNVLYGTTSVSGSGGQGTVFQINTDGSGFAVLHSFAYTDGSQPDPLQLVGGTLYGATTYGVQGISLGDGALFALTLRPTLNISLLGGKAVLTWNDATYSLYSGAVFTNISTKLSAASSPYTTAISGAQQFFQLRAN